MLPALLALLTPAIKPLLDLIPNPQAREKARQDFELTLVTQQTELLKVLQASDQAQADVNKTEAASSSLFVAGWRPFIGWVCGLSFAWMYLGQPIASWAITAFHITGATIPVIPAENMMELLMGMLGLGGLRTFEKIKGAAREK